MDKDAQTIVGDAITSVPTKEERRKMACDLLAYSIGALVAIDGKEAAAETTYRLADATIGLKS